MNNKIDKIFIYLAIWLIVLVFINIYVYEEEHKYFSSKDMYVELPEIVHRPTPTEKPEQVDSMEPFRELYHAISSVPIIVEYETMVTGNSYRMFITAYCAEECGWNYSTSSGEYCHRSSYEYRLTEPTTCAIDLRYFRYGTMFYVPSEDRIYIAEDTGSGVKGLWMDTYQDYMYDVNTYNTRYEDVYVCWFENRTQLCNNHLMDKILMYLMKEV